MIPIISTVLVARTFISDCRQSTSATPGQANGHGLSLCHLSIFPLTVWTPGVQSLSLRFQ